MTPGLLTVREVAEICHVRKSTVRRWVADGVLVAMPSNIFDGRAVRISSAALDAFLRTGLEEKAS